MERARARCHHGGNTKGAAMRLKFCLSLFALALSTGSFAQLSGGIFTANPTTLDGGGGRACDSVGCIAPVWELQATLGQVDAGVARSDPNPRLGFWLYGGFWYAQNPSGATPVTLALVRSTRVSNSEIDVALASSSQVGTVALEIVAAGEPSNWIYPTGDRLTPQHYQQRVALKAASFYVRAHDLDGSAVLHGPFQVGSSQGRHPDLDAPALQGEVLRASAAQFERARQNVLLRGAATPALALRVAQDGFYQLRFDDLAAAGFGALNGKPIAQLALSRRGVATAIEVQSSDSTFNAGDVIRFWGNAATSLDTQTAVYRLEANAALAKRIREETYNAGTSSAASSEGQQVWLDDAARGYSFSAPGTDPFYAQRIAAAQGIPATYSVRFSVPNRLGTQPAQLRVGLWGGTDYPGTIPDHHVQLKLNGQLISALRFDGLIQQNIMVDLLSGQLVAGENELVIELPADHLYTTDVVLLDQMQVRHLGELRVASSGADIGTLRFDRSACTSSEFADGFESNVTPATGCAPMMIQGLADGETSAYRVQGDTMDVIHGQSDSDGRWRVANASLPGAHWLIADSRAWRIPEIAQAPNTDDPSILPADYVVITHPMFAGDLAPLMQAKIAQGLSPRLVTVDDIYGFYSGGEIDSSAIAAFIRTMYSKHQTRYVLLVGAASYDPMNRLGNSAPDLLPTRYVPAHPVVRFAGLDGAYADTDGDGVPNLAIGRLPVRSSSELAVVLQKLQRFSTASYRGKALLVADKRASEGNFASDSQLLQDLLQSYQLQRTDLDQNTIQEVRNTLKTSVDNGVGLVHYLGHSSPTRWSFSNLLNSADVQSGFFDNATRPTLVLQWGCWNSYHAHPSLQSLGSSLLVSPNGTATSVGAATLMDADRSFQLSKQLLPKLNQHGMRIGDALLAASRELAAMGITQTDVQLGISLLGDPALEVQ
jgi:Peptidase family C25